MTPTKDQIEAAAVAHGYEKWENYKYDEQRWAKEDFIAGALWMQALMEKLIEQRERAAFLAATEGPCDDEGRFTPDYLTFEDWKNNKETK